MKRLLLPLLLLGLISTNVHAQTNLDSLYAVWEDVSLADSVRTNALLDYIEHGPLLNDPGSSLHLTNVLSKFARSSGYFKGVVDAYNLSGYTSFRTGDYPRALEMYKRGVALADTIGDRKGKADILLRTGIVYHDNDDVIRGLAYYKEALSLYTIINDSAGISSIYNEFGSIYRMRNDFEMSISYYLKGVAINTAMGDEEANSSLYSNIGGLYYEEEEYVEAQKYFEKAISISERVGDRLGVSSGFVGIGGIHQQNGDLDSALKYCQDALVIDKEVNNVLGIAHDLMFIADVFLLKKQYGGAIRHYLESVEIAQKLGDIGLQESAYYALYESYKELGDNENALKYHELSLSYKDSLNSEETAMELQQFEFRKEVVADSLLQVDIDRKVASAHILEVAAKNRNRNYAIAASVFFLVLAGGFYSRWRYVRKSRAVISKAKERSDNLLLNILPAEIAEELMATGKATARDFDLVSVLFTDFKGFTERSAEIKAVELIEEVNVCFQAFDHICEQYDVEKIKTIGDAYMAAGGLPVPSDTAAPKTVQAALDMQAFMQTRFAERTKEGKFCFEMRLGIHTGPVVAGIVGVKKFQYDIWGDTVNTASRLEGAGSVGRVNISESTYELLKDSADFSFEHRGAIEVKGKGAIEMWFVDRNS